MKAWRVLSTEGSDGLLMDDLEPPALADGVLIDVKAVGIGYPDLLMRRGEFQIPQQVPFTLGWEAAGVVAEVRGESRFTPGDRVLTMTFGACAEQMIAPSPAVFPIPDAFSFAEAAAFPLNYFTALASLRRGRLKPGETVLVHGGAGGVGSAVIQVAKARGAEVYALVSSEDKAVAARDAGADRAILFGENWTKDVLTTSDGIDVVVDPVGGDRLKESLRLLRAEGRYVVVGFAGGSIPSVQVNRLLYRNIDICGCTWSVLDEHPGKLVAAFEELTDLVNGGHLRPIVGRALPFESIKEALNLLDQRASVGKIILEI
jgi:NADPH2:quinone reductase